MKNVYNFFQQVLTDKEFNFLLQWFQGDIINSIEQHVLRAGEAAENAKVETRKAVIYSSKARMVRIKYHTLLAIAKHRGVI